MMYQNHLELGYQILIDKCNSNQILLDNKKVLILVVMIKYQN